MLKYLEAARVLEKIFFEEKLHPSQIGQMRTSAWRHHDAAFYFKSSSANVLELNHFWVGRVAHWVEQDVIADCSAVGRRLLCTDQRNLGRHRFNST